jgi:hypothetical protein
MGMDAPILVSVEAEQYLLRLVRDLKDVFLEIQQIRIMMVARIVALQPAQTKQFVETMFARLKNLPVMILLAWEKHVLASIILEDILLALKIALASRPRQAQLAATEFVIPGKRMELAGNRALAPRTTVLPHQTNHAGQFSVEMEFAILGKTQIPVLKIASIIHSMKMFLALKTGAAHSGVLAQMEIKREFVQMIITVARMEVGPTQQGSANAPRSGNAQTGLLAQMDDRKELV